MNNKSGSLPLVLQPIDGNSWICGASCLSMIFQSDCFNTPSLPKDQNEIAPNVLAPRPYQPGQFYCDNLKMLNYVNSINLTAAYVAFDDPIKALKLCQKHNFGVVILLRLNPNMGAHFVAFSSISKHGVFVNDPLRTPDTINPMEENLNKQFPLSQFPQMTKRLSLDDPEIIVSHSMLVILPPSSKEPIHIHRCRDCGAEIKIPRVLLPRVKSVLYPCNHGVYWVQI